MVYTDYRTIRFDHLPSPSQYVSTTRKAGGSPGYAVHTQARWISRQDGADGMYFREPSSPTLSCLASVLPLPAAREAPDLGEPFQNLPVRNGHSCFASGFKVRRVKLYTVYVY